MDLPAKGQSRLERESPPQTGREPPGGGGEAGECPESPPKGHPLRPGAPRGGGGGPGM